MDTWDAARLVMGVFALYSIAAVIVALVTWTWWGYLLFLVLIPPPE